MSARARSRRSPRNPNLELVGCLRVVGGQGRPDVGELVGIEPLGVAATNDVDALLALKPDCVVYNPMWIDVDELVRILSAGVNVVTTASFITGHNLGDGRDRIEEACEKGGSTMFGSGVSPGFAELLAIVAANGCDRVDKVTIAEAADTTFYDSPETERAVRLRQADRRPRPAADDAQGTRCSARRCDWSPTRSASNSTRSSARPSTRRPPRTSTWRRGPSRRAAWRACTPAGRARRRQDRHRPQRAVAKGQTLDPDWKIDGTAGDHHRRAADGDDAGRLPAAAGLHREAKTIEEFMVLGHIMTAMPPINAIPAVVAAAPGIATYTDLPLTLPRGIVPTG